MQFPGSRAAGAGGAARAVLSTRGRTQPSAWKPYLEISREGFTKAQLWRLQERLCHAGSKELQLPGASVHGERREPAGNQQR